MLAGSHHQNNEERFLTKKEQILISALIEKTPYAEKIIDKLHTYKVAEMDDGRMGSLKFIHDLTYKQQLGFSVAKAEFLDEDDIPVHIVLNLDQKEEIYELDIWKVDFSPLKKIPKPSDLKFLL